MEYWQKILAKVYEFESKTFTGKQVIRGVGFVALCVVVFLVFQFCSGIPGGFSKKDKAKLKENEKIIQQVLSRAEKAEKLAQEYLAQAEYLKKLNDVKADKQTKADVELADKITKSDIIRDQEIKELQNEHQKDLDNINSMSDDDRRRDICARITKLAESDPAFREYLCTK